MSETNQFFPDDAEMNAAIEEARRRLPEFRRALEEDARRSVPVIEFALVKAQFQSFITGKVEHLWFEDAGFEEERIVGTLASEPEAIPEINKGDWLSISPDDVSDWACRRGDRSFGGFTVRVMQKRGLQW